MKNIRLLLFILLMLAASHGLYAQSHQEEYISKYAQTAVYEMYRSGIPASITLAQGLLESGAGLSELAVKSNNHFGIKCHNGWQGGKVYHDDDAKGECFRKYDKAEESYRDHSDFLRYRDRYKFLFEYKITDYKSWAYGLKKAGYATDPSYPHKLINLIETYSLYRFDTKQSDFVQSSHQEHRIIKESVPSSLPAPPSEFEQISALSSERREVFRFPLSREMFSQNGVPFIYAMEGETYRSIAEANNLFLRELLRFNDLKKDAPLVPGTLVYLHKKKNQAVKGLEMHVIEKGETLRAISQRYGVRVSSLCRINGIEKADVIREGDIIRLRK